MQFSKEPTNQHETNEKPLAPILLNSLNASQNSNNYKPRVLKLKPYNGVTNFNSTSLSRFFDSNDENNNNNYNQKSSRVLSPNEAKLKKACKSKGVRFSDQVTIMNSYIESDMNHSKLSENYDHHYHNHQTGIFKIQNLIKDSTYTIFLS